MQNRTKGSKEPKFTITRTRKETAPSGKNQIKQPDEKKAGKTSKFNMGKPQHHGHKKSFQTTGTTLREPYQTDKNKISKPTIKAKISGKELIRLNKYIANSGLCSRREADEYIKTGRVSVNGQVVTEMGIKVKPADEVRVDGKLLINEQKVYIVLNKPKDYLTTREDGQGRRTVMDLLKNACSERIFPVGRLDRNTTGVLLLTNDGELTEKLTHPSYEKRKIYQVTLDRKLNLDDFERISKGIELEDGPVKVDDISFVNPGDHSTLGIEIHSGKNRIVRRIFEHLGYKVKNLDRVYFAGITKRGLARGQWRFLTPAEVNMLYTGHGNKK